MACPHGMVLAFLDSFALLGHAEDDAVDRFLLLGLGLLDLGTVAKKSHWSP